MHFFLSASGHVSTSTHSLFKLSFVFLARLSRATLLGQMLYGSSQQKSGRLVILVSSASSIHLSLPRMISIAQPPGASLLNGIA